MPDERIRETNKAVARQVLAAWNERGETHLPDDLVSPQMVRYFPYPVGYAARVPGGATAARVPGGATADVALPRSAFPDQQFTEQIVIADEQHVFIAWELKATHKGTLYGMQATGKEVLVYGSDIIRLANGKIIQHLDYYPKARMHALAQLGLLGQNVQQELISDGLLGRNRTTGRVRFRGVEF
jgi:hypothetical protein